VRHARCDREVARLGARCGAGWWWLNGALHAVAQMQSERLNGSLTGFREMQEQAREVDRKRLQIAVRIAEMESALTTRYSRTANLG
jgi:hypothetical protein